MNSIFQISSDLLVHSVSPISSRKALIDAWCHANFRKKGHDMKVALVLAALLRRESSAVWALALVLAVVLAVLQTRESSDACPLAMMIGDAGGSQIGDDGAQHHPAAAD